MSGNAPLHPQDATVLAPERGLEQHAHIPLEKATVPDSIMGISALSNL